LLIIYAVVRLVRNVFNSRQYGSIKNVERFLGFLTFLDCVLQSRNSFKACKLTKRKTFKTKLQCEDSDSVLPKTNDVNRNAAT